jgi:DNA-directed RNA polymerase specialized sigma24 family protein
MYLQKMSYSDIAAALNKNEKSVANAICRVKQKLKKHLK